MHAIFDNLSSNNFTYLLPCNERWVQVHGLLAYNLVAHAVHVDRILLLLEVYPDLVNIFFLAARFHVFH